MTVRNAPCFLRPLSVQAHCVQEFGGVKSTNGTIISTGFTLVELLVAIIIFAIMALIAYSGLNQLVVAHAQIEDSSERLEILQKTISLLENDLRQTSNRAIRDPYGDSLEAFIGGRQSFELSRLGNANPLQLKRSNLKRVSWQLVDGKLSRLQWQVLDRAQDAKSEISMQLEGVDSLTIKYFDRVANKWFSEWPPLFSQNTLLADMPSALDVRFDVEGLGQIRRILLLPDGIANEKSDVIE